MKIKIIDYSNKKATAQILTRAYTNDAGADVYSPVEIDLLPGDSIVLPLGFGLYLPDGYAGFIFPRSSMAACGIDCSLPPIDSGYRGEIHAFLRNVGKNDYKIKKGDKIGQLVIIPVLIPDFVLEFSERGAKAFGSSGV